MCKVAFSAAISCGSNNMCFNAVLHFVDGNTECLALLSIQLLMTKVILYLKPCWMQCCNSSLAIEYCLP